jgi:hypothetical protein
MIEHVAPNAANDPLAVRILPRTQQFPLMVCESYTTYVDGCLRGVLDGSLNL